MKKAVVSFIILCLCAVAVFFVGWIQFSVPAGMTGVFVSKTGGIDGKAVENGVFRWQWERLLPTNVNLHLFSNTAQVFTETVSGSLPSAELYSAFLPQNPDFSYTVTVQATLGVKPSELPDLVKNNAVLDNDDLNSYLLSYAAQIASETVKLLLNGEAGDSEAIAKKLNEQKRFSAVRIDSLQMTSQKIPDIALYRTAQETYAGFERDLRENLKKATEQQALLVADDQIRMQRLKNFGELLKEYPELATFLSTTANGTESAIKLLETPVGR